MCVHGSPSDTRFLHAAGACDQQDVPREEELPAASADNQLKLPLQIQSEDCHLVHAVLLYA